VPECTSPTIVKSDQDLDVCLEWNHGYNSNGKSTRTYFFSPGDEEKEAKAQKGRAKFTLFCIGATLDFKIRTLTNPCYPILTPDMTNMDAAPHAAGSSMFGDLLQTTLLEAPSIDPTNLMSNTVSIYVVQWSFLNQMMSGNFATIRAQYLLLKKDVVDPSSFLPQLDQAKIKKVKWRRSSSATRKKFMCLTSIIRGKRQALQASGTWTALRLSSICA